MHLLLQNKKWVLSLALLAPIALAHAGEDSPLEGRAKKFLAPLIEQGVENAGNFQVRQFLAEEIDAVEYVTSDDDRVLTTGSRKSAKNIPMLRTVISSPNFPDIMEDDLDAFSFHEANGAAGYRDDFSYEKTLLLDSIKHVDLEDETKNWVWTEALPGFIVGEKSEVLHHEELSGGIDSVGGGGDINAFAIKRRVLRKIWRDSKGLWLSEMISLLQIQVEPSYDPHKPEPYIVHQWFESILGPSISYTVIVPAYHWENPPNSRQQIVEETADLVVSLYGYGHRNKPNHFSIPSCPGSKHQLVLTSFFRPHPRIEELVPVITKERSDRCEGL